jgi:RND family efflux transporter MFP subunit
MSVAAIVAALALAACGNGEEADNAKAATPVRVAVVETAPAVESLRAVGVLAPADEVATREQVEDLTTASAVAQAQLRSALFNARHARIEAPADGVVLRRLAEPDEQVAAGQPVLVVGNTDGGWIVRAALPDRAVVRLESGQAAEVTFDAFPGRRFTATVFEIAAASDPQTGTYEMKLSIDPAGARFVQGLTAKVVMVDGDADSVAVVPITSLLEADGRVASVFVVAEGGIARRVSVETGRLFGERVEVLDGLTPGDRVITDGAAWLDDNDAVRVLGGG